MGDQPVARKNHDQSNHRQQKRTSKIHALLFSLRRVRCKGRANAITSRFFLLGLSNFQRGCLTEVQTFRIAASATFVDQFLLPVLSDASGLKGGPRYAVELAPDDEIERRLHDLTLDFGIVTAATLSRPLQLKHLGAWRLNLWVPVGVCRSQRETLRALKERRLPLVLPLRELPIFQLFEQHEPQLACGSFLEAQAALKSGALATLLPSFLKLNADAAPRFQCLRVPGISSKAFHYRFAWNPRLLRLNPHAIRRRDFLCEALSKRMSVLSPEG